MTFKMLNTKILLSLVLILVMSCSSKVEDRSDEQSLTTFEHDKIQAIFVQSSSSHPEWHEIKDTITMELESCFLDKQYIQSIVGEKFEIKSDLSSQTVETKTNGCIQWKETFRFDFLADETFYNVKGKIKGTGNYRGEVDYTLAVNPWSEKVVFDSTNVSKMSPFRTKDLKAQIKTDNIKLGGYAVTILSTEFETNETNIKMAINLQPHLVRRKLNGGLLEQKLTSGIFDTDLYLVESDKNTGEKNILDSVKLEDVKVESNGKMEVEASFRIREGIAADATIEVYTLLRAKGQDRLIQTYPGSLKIENIKGRMTGTAVEAQLQLTQLLENKDRREQKVSTKDDFGFVMDKIEITSGAALGRNRNSSSHRSITAKFDIKMIDSLIKKDLNKSSFNVEIYDVENDSVLFSETKSTKLSSGSLEFSVAIPFSTTDRRRWREFEVRVAGLNAPFESGLSKSRIVYINPFQEKSSDFGIDSKFGTLPEGNDEVTQEIFLASASAFFKGNVEESFKLNNNLDLVYNKVLTLDMEPKLKPDRSFDSNFSNYPNLMDGEYNVRFLVLAPRLGKSASFSKTIKLEDYYTLTGDSKVAYVENGRLRLDVELPLLFSDNIYFSLKNLALIEISSVDSAETLKPAYFVGTFNGSVKKNNTIENAQNSGEQLSLSNTGIAKELIERIEKSKNKLQENSTINTDYAFKQFVAGLKNTKMELPAFNSKKLSVENKDVKTEIYLTEQKLLEQYNLSASKEGLTDMILSKGNAGSEEIESICHILFDRESKIQQYLAGSGYAPPTVIETKGFLYKKCIETPREFIKFKAFAHVSEITGQPESVVVESRQYARSNAYFMSKGVSLLDARGVRSSEYTQTGWSFMGESLLGTHGLMGGLSVGHQTGFRVDTYTTKQEAQILSKLERTINSDGVSINYDRYDVRFGAKAKVCLLITSKLTEVEIPKERIEGGLSTIYKMVFTSNEPDLTLVASDKRIYLCAEDDDYREMKDSWYYLKVGNKSLTADEGLGKNTFSTIIRGEENMNAFRQQENNSDESLILHGYDREFDDVTKKYKRYMDKNGKNIDLTDRVGGGFPSLIEL